MKRTLRKTILPLLALLCFTHVQGQSLAHSARFGFAQHQGAPQTNRRTPPLQLRVSDHRDYPQLRESFEWIDTTSNWYPNHQTTFSYNINGWLMEELQSYYQNGTFALSDRRTYTYAPDGQMTEELGESRNGGTWVNAYRYSTTYVGTYPSINLLNIWNGSAWDTIFCFFQRTELNSNNDPVAITNASWNLTTKTWDSTYKNVLTYAAGPGWNTLTSSAWTGTWQLTERIVDVTWHDFQKELPSYAKFQTYTGSAWEDVERLNATYGPHDSYVLVYDQKNGSNWEPYDRETTRFDQQDHQTYSKGEIFDSITQAWSWDYADSANYSYDGNGNTTQVIYLEQDSTQAWNNYWKEVFSNFFVGAAAPIAPQVNVTAYPNPVTDELHFALTDVKPGALRIDLYDLQGRLRVSSSLRYAGQEVVLPVSERLEAGMYTYTLQTASGTATGKVVVQR